MPIPEAIVRTPQQRRRYILKQDVARYGATLECEACTTLAAGAQRVTKPHSDECRARMEELMQRDEDTLVQQRLHADRLRRGSTVVEANEDERRNPDFEMALTTRRAKCEVVDYTSMMMCRSSRLLYHRLSDQRMRQKLT